MRNPMLAKVHIAKKELNLDDETYRSVIQRIAGKQSSGKCTDRQLTKVLEEFKRLGWKPSKKQIFKKAVNPQARKIYALWGELKRLKAVENGDRKALRAFVKRMTNKEAPEWLLPQESYLVIEALKKWIERVE